MRTNIMAFEDLEVDVMSADDSGEIDLGAVMNDGAEDELVTYNRDLSVYTDALELTNQAVDLLENDAVTESGMSHVALEAILSAIDCILKPTGLTWSKPALESMTTLRSKMKNQQMGLEGFKDIASKVWDAIIAMLRRMKEWFLSFFRRSKIQTHILNDKLDRAVAKMEVWKEKQKNQPKPAQGIYVGDVTPVTPKARLTMAQKRHLMVGNAVPVGAKFIQHFHDFMAQAEQFRNRFATFDHEVLTDLKSAVDNIHSVNNEFQTAFGKAHEAVWMSPLSKHANKQPPLSKGVTLFMQPLIFGNMSFYRTGVTGTSNPQTTDALAYVAATPGFEEKDIGDASVEALIEVQWETVLKLCGDEMKRMRAHEDEDHAASMIDTLLRDMERLSKGQTDQRTRGRAAQIHKLLGIYNSFRASGMQALLSYQKSVIDGALEYAVTSIH